MSISPLVNLVSKIAPLVSSVGGAVSGVVGLFSKLPTLIGTAAVIAVVTGGAGYYEGHKNALASQAARTLAANNAALQDAQRQALATSKENKSLEQKVHKYEQEIAAGACPVSSGDARRLSDIR